MDTLGHLCRHWNRMIANSVTAKVPIFTIFGVFSAAEWPIDRGPSGGVPGPGGVRVRACRVPPGPPAVHPVHGPPSAVGPRLLDLGVHLSANFSLCAQPALRHSLVPQSFSTFRLRYNSANAEHDDEQRQGAAIATAQRPHDKPTTASNHLRFHHRQQLWLMMFINRAPD